MKNYNFLTKKTIAFAIAIAIVIAGIVSFIAAGFNFGVDFTGGTKLTLQLKDTPNSTQLDDIEATVKQYLGKDNFVSILQSSSNKKTVIITVKTPASFDAAVRAEICKLYGITEKDLGSVVNDEEAGTSSYTFATKKDVKAEIEKALNALDIEPDAENPIFKDAKLADGKVTITYVSETYTQKMLDKIESKYAFKAEPDESTISKNRASAQTSTALFAAAIAIVLMLVYITLRFKQVSSGIASVICLFFNLFVMFTCFSIFQWEMTLDVIPACLTILGYSINSTIVIFDRIRENYTADDSSFDNAANAAVHSTLLRSVNTTITTLITIVLVYFLGVESIKAFALPLIIGIIAGLFSSVMLASPLWAVLRKDSKKVA